MSDKESTARLKALLKDGKHAEALEVIDTLLPRHQNEVALHWHRARCLDELGREEEGLESVQRVIAIKPDYAPAWLKKAELTYAVQGEYPHMEEEVRKAISLDPKLTKAYRTLAGVLLSRDAREEARAELHKATAIDPNDWESMVFLADMARADACSPEGGEETVEQQFGDALSKPKLEHALELLNRADSLQPENVTILSGRAGVRHELGLFDEALSDYDTLLRLIPEEDPRHGAIARMRRRSEGGGAGEREEMAAIFDRALERVSEEERRTMDGEMATAVFRSSASAVRKGGRLDEAMGEFISDDPVEMAVLNIAYLLVQNGREPEPDFEGCEARDFSKDQQRYAEKARKWLEQEGFQWLGDFEPMHLAEQMARNTLVRAYRSADGMISAASFRLAPKWPGWLTFIFMFVTGKWKYPQSIDLETALSDGAFLVTNNTGGINPFQSGGKILIEQLPPSTGVPRLVTRHRERVDGYLKAHAGVQVRKVESIDDLMEHQRDLTLAKNAYRSSIGFVTEEELKTMLGAQYDALGARVRAKVNRLAALMD